MINGASAVNYLLGEEDFVSCKGGFAFLHKKCTDGSAECEGLYNCCLSNVTLRSSLMKKKSNNSQGENSHIRDTLRSDFSSNDFAPIPSILPTEFYQMTCKFYKTILPRFLTHNLI